MMYRSKTQEKINSEYLHPDNNEFRSPQKSKFKNKLFGYWIKFVVYRKAQNSSFHFFKVAFSMGK